MIDKVCELLKGNYWFIDLEKVNLSTIELDFLSIFFNIQHEIFFDEKENFKEKNFLILEKKNKFLYQMFFDI